MKSSIRSSLPDNSNQLKQLDFLPKLTHDYLGNGHPISSYSGSAVNIRDPDFIINKK